VTPILRAFSVNSEPRHLHDACTNLQTTCLTGVALAAVWYWSGGGLTWIAQRSDIKRLTQLAARLWVRLSAPCMDGVAPVQSRRVPDIVRVNYWHYITYGLNYRGR
jgi:hypothetical protein